MPRKVISFFMAVQFSNVWKIITTVFIVIFSINEGNQEDYKMGFLDKVGRFAEKAGENMAKAATGVADKSKTLAEKTKLKSQINNEKSSINKAYAELGKKYYELSGINPAPEYMEFVSQIKASMVHIEELEQQIAALEIESTCPKCGAAMRRDQQFCQACGSRTENFVDVPASAVEVVPEVERAAENQ